MYSYTGQSETEHKKVVAPIKAPNTCNNDSHIQKGIDISTFRFLYSEKKGRKTCMYYSLIGNTEQYYTVCK